jgi:IS5 family transposase
MKRAQTTLAHTHPGVARAGRVLRGRRGRDNRGVHNRAGANGQPLRAQLLGDFVEQHLAQPLLFEQMAELADGRFVRHRFLAQVDPDKGPQSRRVVQRFFHRRVGQVEPMLEEVHPQHALHADGRPPVTRLRVDRLDPRTQGSPRHDPVHLGQKLRTPRGLRVLHQTQKGRQWYFGMKGHFGVDSQSKLIHSVEVTNIHDSHVLPWLLHGEERRVWGDSAYAGQAGVLSVCAPHARDFTHRRSGRRATNRWKSRIRARVEHPIGVIKRVFGFTKVCYRGLAKNRHRLVVACALANIFMMRKRLLRLQEA